MWKKTVVSVGIGIVCGYFAIKNVDYHQLFASLRNIQLIYFGYAVIPMVLSHLLRALRWQIILSPCGHIPFGSLFGINAVGFMMITVLPLRLGELVRPLLLSRREGISYSSAIATSAVERIFDGLAVLVVLLFGIVLAPLPTQTIPLLGWKIDYLIYATLGTFGPILIFLAMLILFEAKALKVIEKTIRFLPKKFGPKVLTICRNFVYGLNALKGVWASLQILLYSCGIWICIAFVMYLLFAGFSLELPLYATFTVLGIICLGIMIPGPPGFVGNYELFCKAALALFAVQAEVALGFALASHSFNLIFFVIFGLIYLPANPFHLREIRDAEALQLEESA